MSFDMATGDPHRFANDLDDAAIERLIQRLESRAKDAVFSRLLDRYTAHLKLPTAAKVLDVGCGTGAVLRTLAKRGDFDGQLYGVDQCRPFVDAARDFTNQEGIGGRIEFRVDDAHQLNFPSKMFDVVIAHTVISHVSQPQQVLGEMARVVRPDGIVVIFDGDYASLTYAFPDHDFGHRMDDALANATFNNPRIMRDLPRLLPEHGLELDTAWGDAVAEIGSGSYFKSFAETYVPYVHASGALPADAIQDWLATQLQAMERGTFFASCNYYTYLARPAAARD